MCGEEILPEGGSVPEGQLGVQAEGLLWGGGESGCPCTDLGGGRMNSSLFSRGRGRKWEKDPHGDQQYRQETMWLGKPLQASTHLENGDILCTSRRIK